LGELPEAEAGEDDLEGCGEAVAPFGVGVDGCIGEDGDDVVLGAV